MDLTVEFLAKSQSVFLAFDICQYGIKMIYILLFENHGNIKYVYNKCRMSIHIKQMAHINLNTNLFTI